MIGSALAFCGSGSRQKSQYESGPWRNVKDLLEYSYFFKQLGLHPVLFVPTCLPSYAASFSLMFSLILFLSPLLGWWILFILLFRRKARVLPRNVVLLYISESRETWCTAVGFSFRPVTTEDRPTLAGGLLLSS